MKKKTIWTIAIIMGASLFILLSLQLQYMQAMVDMKKEQLDESVNRALYMAARNLELNETLRYLEKEADKEASGDSATMSSFEKKIREENPAHTPRAMILHNDQKSMNEATKSLSEMVRNRYVYQKALLDEVVYTLLYNASQKPLKERVNFKMLDNDIKAELMNNGVALQYHFTVSMQDGREVYRCPDYTTEGEKYTYSQVLFRNDPRQNKGVLRIHFPEMNEYIYSSVKFMIPSVIFTIVLLVTFLFTIVIIFRQKRVSEMRNDFVNNMTHELKTPISSISLAAQMMSDEAVSKSPTMMKHLGGVINDESKRLRFLVEKVLQMSMFDRKRIAIKKKNLDLNDMAETIANTFALRVEHTGGSITTDCGAEFPTIYADEMHFQNVIFNLLDNAVKYRKPDEPVNIRVRTWNTPSSLFLAISDDGMGMKKEDAKKVFEKFYRVHTGNKHDVKGFGLGLAYVKNICDLHKAQIRVESELGRGSTFIIQMPVIREAEDGAKPDGGK